VLHPLLKSWACLFSACTASQINGRFVQGKRLWGVVRQPAIFYPALFLFIWQSTPSADSAMFFFYTEKLHFGPEFLGRVRLAGSVSTLLGVYIFNTYLKRVSLRKIFRWSAVIGTTLTLSQVCPHSPAVPCIFAFMNHDHAPVARGLSFWAVCPPSSESTFSNIYLKKVNLRKIFRWSAVIGSPLTLTQVRHRALAVPCFAPSYVSYCQITELLCAVVVLNHLVTRLTEI
jgi:hypothetical protein